MKALTRVLFGLAIAMIPVSASADLVSYEFSWIVTSGTLNGNDISGQTIIATGQLVDDTDLDALTNRGAFAGLTTYSLSGGGTVSGVSDFMWQFQSGVNSQYGLLNTPGSTSSATRLQDSTGISPMADPNVAEATGSFRYENGIFGGPRTVVGTGGTLIMTTYGTIASGNNVRLSAVPEPGSLAILGLTAAGLFLRKRNRV